MQVQTIKSILKLEWRLGRQSCWRLRGVPGANGALGSGWAPVEIKQPMLWLESNSREKDKKTGRRGR
jgi:hypothetical protein